MSKLEQAKKIVQNEGMYESNHICWSHLAKTYYLAERLYATYDGPSWTTHFRLTEDEAEEIAKAGVARYWMNCNTWDKTK